MRRPVRPWAQPLAARLSMLAPDVPPARIRSDLDALARGGDDIRLILTERYLITRAASRAIAGARSPERRVRNLVRLLDAMRVPR